MLDGLMRDVEAAHTLALAIDSGRIRVDCGHVATPTLTLIPEWRAYADTPGRGAAGGTGYATTSDGRKICYACSDKEQREAMKSADVFVAYLSADNRSVITWSGGRLGTVTRHSVSTAARKTYVRVTDVHGAAWHGVGPAESGTYVRLRRSQAK